MSLTLALNNALSGLQINQRSLGVLSQNIANANTKGYSRQLVEQSARYVAGIGAGVKIESINRKIDQYLQRAVQTQTSGVGLNNVRSDYAERLQILFGEPGSKNSVDEFINNFFNSAQALAETPELPSLRTSAVNAGAKLAREISGLAANIEDLRYQADRDISETVKQINAKLNNLYTINQAISNANAVASPTVGLLDQRDIAINELSDFLDIKINYQEDGQVQIYAASGTALLDENRYQLQYTSVSSVQVLINDGALSPIQVQRIGTNGQPTTDNPVILVTGGKSSEVTTAVKGGKLKALLDQRDRSLPDILSQLDRLAANIRDRLNAVHNNGSSFPGATALTGTRSISGEQYSQWSGKAQIAILDKDGRPVRSQYNDETSGIRPLTIDFSKLDSGFGAGSPTTQTIIDEINAHFGVVGNRAKLGNINNIRLGSLSSALPGLPPQFNFDLELENISGRNSDLFVTGVTVLDDTAANITSVTNTLPSLGLNPVNTFTTTAGSNVVTVATSSPHGLSNGDRIYLPNPGGPVNGIPAVDFNNILVVSNVTTNGFDVTLSNSAAVSGPVSIPALTALPKYDTIEAGEKTRTADKGSFSASLLGNPTSLYYDIQLNVAIADANGQVSSSTITYRVTNNQSGLLNDRYNVTAVTGAGTLAAPDAPGAALRAILVDAQGNELPKVNGDYVSGTPGFLRLVTTDSNNVVSISELDSKELGVSSNVPPTAASNWGFSHYFGLNNFFDSNNPIAGGDTLKNSAIKLKVQTRLENNPSLVTTGRLTRSNQPVDPTDDPLWTYERFASDNDAAQDLAKLNLNPTDFDAAGSLPSTSQTFTGYAGQILGLAASNAVAASNDLRDSQILLDGFAERATNISGVNLDEELANTVIYQNAYTASTRVITVTNSLFEALLSAFQ